MPDINQKVKTLEETLDYLIQAVANLTELVQEIAKVVPIPTAIISDYNAKVEQWKAVVNSLE